MPAQCTCLQALCTVNGVHIVFTHTPQGLNFASVIFQEVIMNLKTMNGYIAWKILQTCELHLHVAFVGYVLLNMWIFLSGEHRCGRRGR